MKTIEELADIGTEAAIKGLYGNLCVRPSNSSYHGDAPHREAFAAAVRDAMLADVDQEIAELKESNADLKRKLAISRSALERILHPHHSRITATSPSWAIAAEALEATKP